jgi:Arc/MetJ-type ribon-helix-helix transcriptional regulator
MGTHTRTRRHSSINTLPPDVREEMETLILDENRTYDEVVEFLRSKGHSRSRSAVVRYGKRFFEEVRDMKIGEEQARALVSEAGENGLALEEANTKLMGMLLMKLLREGNMDPEVLQRLMNSYAALQHSSVNRENLKERQEKKYKRAADEDSGKPKGLSDEAVREIKRKILGFPEHAL